MLLKPSLLSLSSSHHLLPSPLQTLLALNWQLMGTTNRLLDTLLTSGLSPNESNSNVWPRRAAVPAQYSIPCKNVVAITTRSLSYPKYYYYRQAYSREYPVNYTSMAHAFQLLITDKQLTVSSIAILVCVHVQGIH